jgi:vacuolar-type H+-ATPase subunit H
MNTANLKIDLINKITQIKETNVIKEIKRVLDFELDEGIFQLTNAQKKRIADAKQEIKQKKYLAESAANKEISQWLDK